MSEKKTKHARDKGQIDIFIIKFQKQGMNQKPIKKNNPQHHPNNNNPLNLVKPRRN